MRIAIAEIGPNGIENAKLMIPRHKVVLITGLCIACTGCRSPLEDHYLRTSAAHAAVDLNALQRIRNGDTNAAIYTLERDLNNERINMEMFTHDSEKNRDETVVRLLKKIHAYQESHPWVAKTNRDQ